MECFDVSGRVAIVTGASSGLGERFARVLHSEGATVVLCARRADRIEAVARSLGANAIPCCCDVTDVAVITRVVERAAEVSGHIDVRVNNAGTSATGPAEDLSASGLAAVLGVNLVGAVSMCAAVGRRMLDQGGGVIINVASMYGLVASSPVNDAAYAASKGGLVNLTRELAVQWARRGVRVNALAPGWFPTEMNEELWADERTARRLERTAPLGRPGRPHELDGALLFLASDASTYMTGQVLVVDGGWTAR
jgi:NAD(P)-dependent dehydrogenase (short-subunit alcohol dehydrogenase family)